MSVIDPREVLAPRSFTPWAAAVRATQAGISERYFLAFPLVEHATVVWPQQAVYTDPRIAARRAVAVSFARIARNIRGVEGVWLHETVPDLEVVLVMRELDLDRELELRGIFIELVSGQLDPSVGELSVYIESEHVPEWVREGEELP